MKKKYYYGSSDLCFLVDCMIDLISSKTLSVMRSFSISSGDITIFITVGDLIFYKRYPSTRGLRVVLVFFFFFFFFFFCLFVFS